MPQNTGYKEKFNIRGKETLALIFLNLIVILGLAVFYVLVLRNKIPETNNNVLGTANCQGVLISGEVYNDKNANGVRDSGEIGINQVSVILKTDSGQEFTVTNPGANNTNASDDGVYEVCVPKNQSVRVMFKNFSPYYPGPHGSASKTSVAFVYASANQKVSLGLIGTDSPNVIEIGDRIWEDTNGNGIQDPGEKGIPGVTVKLRDFNTNNVIATTKTDSNGLYYFSSKNNSSIKPESTYLITIDKSEFTTAGKPLEGTKTTKYRQGGDGYIDSDTAADQEKVEIPVVIGVGGCNQCIHNYDIGVVRVRNVTGTPTVTATSTGTPTATATSTSTPTSTVTVTRTPTATVTITTTATSTPSITATVTVTYTPNASPTGTATTTPSTTATTTTTTTPSVSGTSVSGTPSTSGSPYTTQASPSTTVSGTGEPSTSEVLSGSTQNLPNTGLGGEYVLLFGVTAIALGGLSYINYKRRFKIRLGKITQK